MNKTNKELPTKQYRFYRDPSHAWLAVTRQELIDLHIDAIISKHSYQKGNLVYLEEDSDANLFLNKVIHQAKFNLELIDKHTDKDSIIRTYKPYSPDNDQLTEYRWENTAIGQGHYYVNLSDCMREAQSYAQTNPEATLSIEQFKPLRKPLFTIKGQEIKPWQTKGKEPTFKNLSTERNLYFHWPLIKGMYYCSIQAEEADFDFCKDCLLSKDCANILRMCKDNLELIKKEQNQCQEQ